jgi:hypothetical protein
MLGVLSSLIGLFIFVCVFDPANHLTGLKSPLFGLLWLVTLIGLAINRSRMKLPAGLLAYVLAFIAIPLLSIVWYFVIDGSRPFEGFQLFKGYVLVSIALVLFLNRSDSVPLLCAALTGLAVVGVALFVYLEINPHAYYDLKHIADPTGVLILDKRTFGAAVGAASGLPCQQPDAGVLRRLLFPPRNDGSRLPVDARMLGLGGSQPGWPGCRRDAE